MNDSVSSVDLSSHLAEVMERALEDEGDENDDGAH
jgi:hypothetical protein